MDDWSNERGFCPSEFEKKFLRNAVTREVSAARLIPARDGIISLLQEQDPGAAADGIRASELSACADCGGLFAVAASGTFAGYIALLRTGHDSAKLLRVYVVSEYRSQGLGSALCAFADERARLWRMRFLTAEAHPNNLHAVTALLGVRDMRLVSLRLRFERGLRYLLCRDSDDSRLFNEFAREQLCNVYGVSKLLAHGYVSAGRGIQNSTLWFAR